MNVGRLKVIEEYFKNALSQTKMRYLISRLCLWWRTLC